MPSRIATLISSESSQNKLTGVVSILANLIEKDHRVEAAYLCDDEAIQVHKFPREGNHFCGYRNIQMLLAGEQHSIPEIQDLIESAWDMGHNSHGRIETGGIKDTRKHIGTSEVCAQYLFKAEVNIDGVILGRSTPPEPEYCLHSQSIHRTVGMEGALGRN
jgi:hypothetical protein